VIRKLGELEEGDFQLLILREFDHLSYEELAMVLGVPQGTVMSRLHRARLALAQELKRMGISGPLE
jgi:RNA polymerase sigma-70 factor (ECF subfamily)